MSRPAERLQTMGLPADETWRREPRSAAPPARTIASRGVAAEIRDLLVSGGIRIALQPVLRLVDLTVLGYEGLARYVPRGVLRTPEDLFSAAAAAGLDRQVYGACLEAALAVGQNILPATLFLNVSVETLLDADPPGRHLAALATAAGFTTGDVVLEISERTPIHDISRLREAVKDLRGYGFRIAIDDAGAGHASMLVIAEVEPDFIKVDRELIHAVDVSAPRRALVVSLLSFGAHIDARVIAEGIETEAELRTLLSLGVEFGQGWHLGRPAVLAPIGDLKDVIEVRPGWFRERPTQPFTLRTAERVLTPNPGHKVGALQHEAVDLTTALVVVAEALQFEDDPARILEIVGTQLQRVVALDNLTFYAANHLIHCFVPAWASGPTAKETMVDSFSMDAGVTGWAFGLGVPQRLGDVSHHPAARTVPGTPAGEIESMLLVPLIAGDRRLGMLNCARLGLDRFSADDLRSVALFGHMAAAAWRNLELAAEVAEGDRNGEHQALPAPGRAAVGEHHPPAPSPAAGRTAVAVTGFDGFREERRTTRVGLPRDDGDGAGPAARILAAPSSEPSRAGEAGTLVNRLAAELDALEMLPFSDSEAAFGPAVTIERLAGELGVRDLELRARLVQADVLGRKGKFTASGQQLRDINAWAVDHGHRHLQARSHRLLSMFFDSIGDFASSWEHAVRAVEIVDDTMSDRLRADHLLGLGVALVRTGAFAGARERYVMALQLAERLDDVPLRVKLLNHLAWLEDEAGDPRRSLELAESMRGFAAQRGISLDAACLDTIAHAQVLLGLYVEAEETLRPILEEEDLSELETEGLAEALRTAAEAQRLQGNLGRARATLGRCLRFCDERDLGGIRVQVLQEQAEIYASEGKFKQAYERHRFFHNADVTFRSAEREANARTMQAVFETAEARREGERFRELSLRDPLTGLRNRRFVDSELASLLQPRVEEAASTLSIALVDLDHFKSINDQFSHAIGDEVLRRVGKLLAAATADSGFAARMGGEEFLIVIPDVDAGAALGRLDDVRLAIRAYPWEELAEHLAVTVSIGVASAEAGRTSQAGMLGQADRNLYAAKKAGRDRVVGDVT